jgi:hypothetical protein
MWELVIFRAVFGRLIFWLPKPAYLHMNEETTPSSPDRSDPRELLCVALVALDVLSREEEDML